MSKFAVFFIALAFTFSSLWAEGNNEKTVKILTNAHCGACKTKIEKKLNDESGVLGSKLNLDDKIVEVKYNPDKTSPDKLTNAIASLKFDAKVVDNQKEAKVTESANHKECSAKSSDKACCPKSSVKKSSDKSCSSSSKCSSKSKSCEKTCK